MEEALRADQNGLDAEDLVPRRPAGHCPVQPRERSMVVGFIVACLSPMARAAADVISVT